MCKQLAREAIGMLRFDNLGLGDSEGDWSDAPSPTRSTTQPEAVRWIEGTGAAVVNASQIFRAARHPRSFVSLEGDPLSRVMSGAMSGQDVQPEVRGRLPPDRVRVVGVVLGVVPLDEEARPLEPVVVRLTRLGRPDPREADRVDLVAVVRRRDTRLDATATARRLGVRLLGLGAQLARLRAELDAARSVS